MLRTALIAACPACRQRRDCPTRYPRVIGSRSMACRCITRSPARAIHSIVLHGAYMNIPTMGAIIPRTCETHKVYAVELQGHGRTTDIDRPITYPNLADDVAAFMDAVEHRKKPIYSAIRWGRPQACSWPSATLTRVDKLDRRFRRLRCRRLATRLQGVHSADDGRDVRRHALRTRSIASSPPIPTGSPLSSRS